MIPIKGQARSLQHNMALNLLNLQTAVTADRWKGWRVNDTDASRLQIITCNTLESLRKKGTDYSSSHLD